MEFLLFYPLFRGIPAWGICILPQIVLIGGLALLRRKYEQEARLPFTDAPLRLPGQSARERADRLADAAIEKMILLLFAGEALALWYALAPVPIQWGGFLLGVILLAAIFVGARMNRQIRESWDYRLGAAGEQVIGRELDRLMATGHRVFHDVPFERWNIDHVVVGPTGVFAVETKTWRKQRRPSGEKPQIFFDGESLRLPGRPPDREPVAQARCNAASLAKLIAAATAEAVPVVPVLAIPGWFLSVGRYSDVAVYSGSGMSDHLAKRGKARLMPEQIQRIAFQLAKLCAVRDGSAVQEIGARVSATGVR